ncbi:hypothetical protein HDU81_002504 [Chytriomyces hyalinus]|nr:hypothetical protein HDU81_002504 [Chytriomyces hyalinus]
MKLLSLTLAASSLATCVFALAEPGFEGFAYDPESVTNFFNRVSGPDGELLAPKGFGQGCTNATVGSCAEGLSCVLNSPAPDESVMVDLEAGICMKAQGEGEECGGDTVFAAVCKAPLVCTGTGDVKPGSKGVCKTFTPPSPPAVKDVVSSAYSNGAYLLSVGWLFMALY